MYVMFPRRDGPINLIIVANPLTDAGLSESMCYTDVRSCVRERLCTCVRTGFADVIHRRKRYGSVSKGTKLRILAGALQPATFTDYHM